MSDRPVFCTVAQIARRVGRSDGWARTLWAAGSLPTPDGWDDDNHPLWLESTVDCWWGLRSQPKAALIDQLLERSPLGTPGARAVAAGDFTSPGAVAELEQLDRELEVLPPDMYGPEDDSDA